MQCNQCNALQVSGLLIIIIFIDRLKNIVTVSIFKVEIGARS